MSARLLVYLSTKKVCLSTRLLKNSSYYLVHRLASVVVKPLIDTVAHLDCHLRVKEVGRTNLDCRGASHEELYRVMGVADTAKTHHGYLHRLGHLPYHAQGHRLHRRAAQSPPCRYSAWGGAV